MTRAEESRADTYIRGAMANSDLEIIAHAHGEPREAVSAGNLGQKRKVRTGRLVDRWNAHQAFDGEIENLAADFKKVIGLGRRYAGLLAFLPSIDLDIETRRVAEGLDFASQSFGKLGSIKGLDDIKEGNGVARLVGLQRPNQTEFKAQAPLSPPRHGLLHTVFAEDALTCGEHRRDGAPGLLLGDRSQPYVPAVSARGCRRGRDPRGYGQKGCAGFTAGR